MAYQGIRVVLASKSPRRRELLSQICDGFDIMSEEVDESFASDIAPREAVEMLSVRKGRAVVQSVDSDTLVISSDTLVEADGIPLGKPTDENDAFRMLRTLSGRYHNVHTGVAVHYRGRCFSGTATSHVLFKKMTDADIWGDIETKEPMDKAGAYGIQGIGGKFVESYQGDFDTIMGLSVSLTKELMDRAIEECV